MKTKFKVGDKVVITKNDYGSQHIGRKGFVTDITKDGCSIATDINLKEHTCNESDFHWFFCYGEFCLVETKTDPIVKSVVKQFKKRSKKGISKYGTTLAENEKDDFLQHAMEEAMDLALYLAKIKKTLKDKGFDRIEDLIEWAQNK